MHVFYLSVLNCCVAYFKQYTDQIKDIRYWIPGTSFPPYPLYISLVKYPVLLFDCSPLKKPLKILSSSVSLLLALRTPLHPQGTGIAIFTSGSLPSHSQTVLSCTDRKKIVHSFTNMMITFCGLCSCSMMSRKDTITSSFLRNTTKNSENMAIPMTNWFQQSFLTLSLSLFSSLSYSFFQSLKNTFFKNFESVQLTDFVSYITAHQPFDYC